MCFAIFCQNNNRTLQDTVFIRYNDNQENDIINYVTDTIVPESGVSKEIMINGHYGYMLWGTTILPTGANMIFHSEYGLNFVKVTKSNCLRDEYAEDFEGVAEAAEDLDDHINSILITDSTLIIDFNIIHNCCYEFLCDINIDTTGTLSILLSVMEIIVLVFVVLA
jgi:hypothetical protein